MSYKGHLTAVIFIAIYLVSYNIGYQFQELSYFLNTRKSSGTLQDKYKSILSKTFEKEVAVEEVFPISLRNVSVVFNQKTYFQISH